MTAIALPQPIGTRFDRGDDTWEVAKVELAPPNVCAMITARGCDGFCYYVKRILKGQQRKERIGLYYYSPRGFESIF